MKNLMASFMAIYLGGILTMPYADAEKIVKPKHLPKVKLTLIRELTVPSTTPSGRPDLPISGVSGAVRAGTSIYFVSDSQATLFQMNPETFAIRGFKLGTAEVGVTVAKAQKLDLESLVFVPDSASPSLGTLIAFPSASTPMRETAFLIDVLPGNEIGVPKSVSISALATVFRKSVSGLNVEGFVVADGKAMFLQRGNERGSKNGIFKLNLVALLKGFRTGEWKDALASVEFETFKIGKLQRIKLTLTDGVWTSRGLIALAAAEGGESAYSDGKIHGSILIRMEGNEPILLVQFDPPAKLEAIILEKETPESLEFLVFDDPDDEKKGSRLFKVVVPKVDLPNSESSAIIPQK